MKMQTLFDLLEASQDFLAIFEDVSNVAQLVSRLERLKRLDVEGVLEDLDALRVATSNALEDNIELGGSLGSADSEFDLSSLGGVLGEDEPETENAHNNTAENHSPATAPLDGDTPQEIPDTTT